MRVWTRGSIGDEHVHAHVQHIACDTGCTYAQAHPHACMCVSPSSIHTLYFLTPTLTSYALTLAQQHNNISIHVMDDPVQEIPVNGKSRVCACVHVYVHVCMWTCLMHARHAHAVSMSCTCLCPVQFLSFRTDVTSFLAGTMAAHMAHSITCYIPTHAPRHRRQLTAFLHGIQHTCTTCRVHVCETRDAVMEHVHAGDDAVWVVGDDDGEVIHAASLINPGE